jgi:tRNA (adenine-N(1)-)-methyltransferase non-catalytic subunit
MRHDALSILLNKSNVRAGSKVLVVDNTNGLITAGLLERMGGHGTMVLFCEKTPPNMDLVRYMNFPSSVTDVMKCVAWSKLLDEAHDYDNNIKEIKEKLAQVDHPKRKEVLERGYENLVKGKETKEILEKGGFDR